MDPTATLRLFIDAIAEGDLDSAGQAASDYRRWILRGGFPASVAIGGEAFSVSVLDVEMDRIGVCRLAGDACDRQTEKWLACDSVVVMVS